MRIRIRNKFKILVIVFLVVGLLSVACYAGIRVKPHGQAVLNPELSYIVSETVVEDGRLVSDKIVERKLIAVKEVEKVTPSPSKFSKVLHKWGVGLLDMFVCNMYVD